MSQKSTHCDVPDAGLISDLVLDWILSFSPLLPGCALQRISLVCVKDEDDLIKASREVHQFVIEAYTEILHCHYSCWFCYHFLDKDHAIYHCYLPTVIRGICISLYRGFSHGSMAVWYGVTKRLFVSPMRVVIQKGFGLSTIAW